MYYYDPEKLTQDEKHAAWVWVERIEEMINRKLSRDEKDNLISGFYAGLQFQKTQK